MARTNPPNPKRSREVPVSYVTAVTQPLIQDTTTALTSTNYSTSSHSQIDLSQVDITKLVDRLSMHFQSSSSTSVTTEDLELQFRSHQKEINTMHTDLDTAIATIWNDIVAVKEDIKKQNSVILGFQREVMVALQDFARKLYYLTNSSPQGAATSQPQPLGVAQTWCLQRLPPVCPNWNKQHYGHFKQPCYSMPYSEPTPSLPQTKS